MPSLRKYSNDPNFVGYPLFYTIGHGPALCSSCAREEKSSECYSSTDFKQHCNWEDPNLYCDICSVRIESAYGDD